jgi:O-antigen/teichoic acid export membrane protein
VPRRPDETEWERLDRNMEELLQELRVALPGVQVLFGFLLTVPFAQGFQKVTDFQRDVYLGTLLCAGAATALLIAISAYHRIVFRKGEKRHLLFLANRLTIAGLGFLAVAMTGAILLVTDYLFATATAAFATAAVGGLFATFWYILPLIRRFRDESSEDEG